MIDEDTNLERRVRIIARTLVRNRIPAVSGTLYYTAGELDHLMVYPQSAQNIALLGNDMQMRAGLHELLDHIAADLEYAGDCDYPTSKLELHIRADGSWDIEESYTEEQLGENGYSANGRADITEYETAA